MENSKIEWTHNTFNPVIGCVRVSPGCDHCYAETLMRRYGKPELWEGERRRTTPANWRNPVKWNREAAAALGRVRVFCASLSDVFDNGWETEWRDDLWALIRATPALDWQLLTKRPENIARMLPPDWGDGYPNVWLGATAEDAEHLASRAWKLSQVKATVRFLSVEPMLGDMSLRNVTNRWGTRWNVFTGRILHAISGPSETGAIHWIICGGESGPGRRPMQIDWARRLRDECKYYDVPFFMKQIDKVIPIPPDLLIRQFPVSP